MHVKKLIGGLALAGVCAAGVAYAAATSSAHRIALAADSDTAEAQVVSITWPMGTTAYVDVEGTASDASVFTSSTVSINGNIEPESEGGKVRTAKPVTGEIKMTSYKTSAINGTVEPDTYVAFSANLAKSVNITDVSLDWGGVKHGQARANFEMWVDGTCYSLNTAQVGTRINENSSSDSLLVYTYSTRLSAPVTANSSVEVRALLYSNDGSARSIGIANVNISGYLAEGSGEVEEPENPVPDGWASVPGVLSKVTEWTTSGSVKLENTDSDKPNFGSIQADAKLSTEFYCVQAGAYKMVYDFTWSNGSTEHYINFEVIDQATGAIEASTTYLFNGRKTGEEIPLNGKITEGKKTFNISFTSANGGYITNFAAPEFVWVGDDAVDEPVAGMDHVPGQFQEISADNWTCSGTAKVEDNSPRNIGYAKNGSTAATKFYCDKEGEYSIDCNFTWFKAACTVTFTVTDLAGNVEAAGSVDVTGTGVKTIYLDNPLTTGTKTLTVSFASEDTSNYLANFVAPLFNMLSDSYGAVTSLTIGAQEVTDEAVLAALNTDAAATIADQLFTTVPAVKATFESGDAAEAAVTVDGTTATATFTGKDNGQDKEYSLTIEGIHLYTAAETDKTVEIRYDSANKQDDGSWSNGLYTLYSANDGWGGTQFKLKTGTHRWEVPSNIVVKQIKFCQLGDNYAAGRVSSVTSEGATVYLPTYSEFTTGDANRYDLVVNIENHTAGEPVYFTFADGQQPYAWFEFIVEEQKYQGAPVAGEISATATDTRNHTVVTVPFGRVMRSCAIDVNGTRVTAEGGSSSLMFALWNLPWDATTTFTIPAGAAADIDGNATTEDITYDITVGSEGYVAVLEAENAYTEVATVDELRAAIADVMATNTTADAPRRVIYLKNGDYDLGEGTEVALLHLDRAYNVSLIGESRDGVLLHGSVTGISYPVFSTRNSTNIYMENFTIRNDYDFGQEVKGVAVAHYGGNRDVMVNMCLQSQQDTQVTGEQGYYLNCEIHGKTDYICGGGDHFYDHCVFVMTAEGGVIAAPSTSASTKWGYVFSHCVIKGEGNYDLGRPWQNEPRCAWINTTMEAASSERGWREMSQLPTHFYEYGSVDADGKAVDLSKRQNSSSSTNTYDPVLTAEEAALYTVENVLGGSDSWYPVEEIVDEMPAPEAVWIDTDANQLHWEHVAKAAAYLVYDAGQLIATLPATCDYYDFETAQGGARVMALAVADDYQYTVRALSQNGTASAHSVAITPDNLTGIATVGADAAATTRYFNLQGVEVGEGFTGVCVEVAIAADGSTTARKVIRE